MRGPGLRRGIGLVLALVLVVAGAGWPAPGADAQIPVQSLGGAIVGSPALGVAGDGEAVLAWSGSATISASVRRAGGVFGARRSLSGRGKAARGFALGVGRSGDAVVVWPRADRRRTSSGPILAAVRHRRQGFRRAVRVPGSAGGRGPAAAVAPDGSMLVAWRRAKPGCGSVVMASVARRGRPFAAARRVSGRCPHAAAVRAAMSADGTGGVVWRAGRAAGSHAIAAAPLGRTRFGSARRVSRAPVVTFGAEVASDATGALVVWRERIPGEGRVLGRVLSADVTPLGVGAVVPVSVGDRVVGVPRVSARPDGSALVTWEEEGTPPPVLAAARFAGAQTFGPPSVADGCGATDASRTYASPTLDGGGSTAVVFQSSCMSRFGLGTDYGIALTRRPPGEPWQAPQALSHGTYSTGAVAGAADDGELITAWVESGLTGGLRAAVIPR